MARESASDDLDVVNADLAEHYFFPAKSVVESWCARQCGRAEDAEGEAIPRQIFQYWNTPAIPDQVASVMESWRMAAGFRYRRLDRKEGLEFLHERFGPDYVRAFRLANHPAEECDFLRLCILFADGGIYADADDKLVDDPGRLLAGGKNLILFRETFGALANNVICAAPGHPLLGIAAEKACRSLLARENDGTWSKTGPGLMTRAAASYILRRPASETHSQLSIWPLQRLRRHVQPHIRLSYKSTVKYWNATERSTPGPILDALARWQH